MYSRKKLGLQQKQVAKMVGITNVSLCKVQTGEQKIEQKEIEDTGRCLKCRFI